ncbi:hypothetical protein FTUN_1918 [Frigoriglobus tundricola]|uniref:Uncharacterized protein n=1 Tax=Frigoriglobus tundricola TaxID=2774151 RepID=A0A6M5YK90_9BACT|nr:hypothetical protein FTUN_1918 [Frigoriglobus tundricola]
MRPAPISRLIRSAWRKSSRYPSTGDLGARPGGRRRPPAWPRRPGPGPAAR